MPRGAPSGPHQREAAITSPQLALLCLGRFVQDSRIARVPPGPTERGGERIAAFGAARRPNRAAVLPRRNESRFAHGVTHARRHGGPQCGSVEPRLELRCDSTRARAAVPRRHGTWLRVGLPDWEQAATMRLVDVRGAHVGPALRRPWAQLREASQATETFCGVPMFARRQVCLPATDREIHSLRREWPPRPRLAAPLGHMQTLTMTSRLRLWAAYARALDHPRPCSRFWTVAAAPLEWTPPALALPSASSGRAQSRRPGFT